MTRTTWLMLVVLIMVVFSLYYILKTTNDPTVLVPQSLEVMPSSETVATVIDKGSQTTANLISGKFSLTDHNGKKRTHLDFRGRVTLVYFGYIFCPDVCPQALSNISSALYTLKDQAASINTVFITIDPVRDQVGDLNQYLQNFHPSIVALTGDEQHIAEAAQSFRVYYNKADNKETSDYLMDHTSIIYVMDKRGRYVTSFNHETKPAQIVSTLLKIL